MSAIVRADAVDIAGELPQIFKLAGALKQAGGFLPQHIRNEGELVAIILAGRELGIAPMAALRSINLIKGRVTLAADMQLALMMRAGARVQWISDGSNGVAKLQLARPGQQPHVQTFTMEDAKTAGLAGGENWKKYPAAMLRARCVSGAAKAYFPDVLSGVYTPDELEPVDAEIVDAHGEVKPAAARPFEVTTTPSTPRNGNAGTATDSKLDEYGLIIPRDPCPVIGPGKPNAGKSWDKLNGPVIEKMYAEFGDKMSTVQKEWAEYLMAKRQARKAREAAEKARAAELEAMADPNSEGGGWVAGDEATGDPEPTAGAGEAAL